MEVEGSNLRLRKEAFVESPAPTPWDPASPRPDGGTRARYTDNVAQKPLLVSACPVKAHPSPPGGRCP